MSGPMVRAIFADGKTQTRRVMKPQPACGCIYEMNGNGDKAVHWDGKQLFVPVRPTSASHLLPCRFGGPGDHLYVREAWRQHYPKTEYSDGIVYRADAPKALGMGSHSDSYKWKSPIHMPKKYARLWLEVCGVHCGRLQDISEGGALAEGVDHVSMEDMPRQAAWSRRHDFSRIWNKLNASTRHGWNTNPWVWIITFRRIKPAK